MKITKKNNEKSKKNESRQLFWNINFYFPNFGEDQ